MSMEANYWLVDVPLQAAGASHAEGACGVGCEAQGPGHRHHPAVIHSLMTLA